MPKEDRIEVVVGDKGMQGQVGVDRFVIEEIPTQPILDGEPPQ
jgi:hypothetical protein